MKRLKKLDIFSDKFEENICSIAFCYSLYYNINKIKLQVVSDMKCKKKLIKRLFSTLLSSLTFSGISVSANIVKELKQEVKNEMRLEDIKIPKRC